MRSFEYSFNGQEVHIDCKDESGIVVFTCDFPTHVGAVAHWSNDFNWKCDQLNQPHLTEEERTALRVVIDSMPKDL